MARSFSMDWGTASACRCMKRRSWDTGGQVDLWIGSPSPSSPACTCPARVGSELRTPSSSGLAPLRLASARLALFRQARDRRSCLPLPPGTCSSCDRTRAARHCPQEITTVATTNDLKNGITLNLDGQLWTVVEFQHVKPGKGGAFVRTKLKNVLSGKVVDRTFNAGTRVEVANVDKREMQYLYREGEDFVFMDTQDYDQPHIPAAVVGDAANYLLEEQTAVIAFNDGTPLYIELPAAVELTVEHTDPGLQGDRSTGSTKPATLETGAQIQVPLFIVTGEKIRVDTRDGSYLGRA